MNDKLFQKAYKKHVSGDRETAKSLYEDILKKSPKHTDVHYMLGTLLAETGSLEAALTHLKTAAQQAPKSPMIQTNLGNVYFKLGKLGPAQSHYQRALESNPKTPETLFNLSAVLLRQGRRLESVIYLERILKTNPNLPDIWHKLASIYKDLNQISPAIKYLKKFITKHPDNIAALFDLGNMHAAQNKPKEALIYFEEILKISPENQSAQHVIAALTGKTTPTAPPRHVAQLFDEMSSKFDSHLKQLGYRVPEMLTELLISVTGKNTHFKHAIDLGCGTGLLGAQTECMVSHLTGLDLSPKMIDLARSKSIYDELAISDICTFLNTTKQHYDLFMSTDVFIYIGDLTDVFQAVKNHASSKAYFIFSTEEALEQNYILRQTGRYAQSKEYIASLADTYGFSIKACQNIDLRMEGTQAIKGDLFVLKFVQTT